MSGNIATKIWGNVNGRGGIKVPYSEIYEDLNAVEASEKKKVREAIRSCCSEKKTYKKAMKICI